MSIVQYQYVQLVFQSFLIVIIISDLLYLQLVSKIYSMGFRFLFPLESSFKMYFESVDPYVGYTFDIKDASELADLSKKN